jgi:Tol biopolymer transport system component
MPTAGGLACLISPEPPTWLHGVAPDGSGMVYCAARGAKTVIDIYSKTWDGTERRLTMGEGMCDGPDYAADGTKIYYNCDRTGHAQIWVMNADGTDQRQVFADDHVNWFPHPSPDGAHVLYMAYPKGTKGHPRDLPVYLCLMEPDGTNRRIVLGCVGGQGSINVNGADFDVNGPIAFEAIAHDAHTEGTLEIEAGDGVTLLATCFAPGTPAS